MPFALSLAIAMLAFLMMSKAGRKGTRKLDYFIEVVLKILAHSAPPQGLSSVGPAGSGNINVIVRPRPKPKLSTTSQNTMTLYYTPSAATVDGQLYLPQVVYDKDGKEIDLKALQLSSKAEVYLEPPPPAQLTQQELVNTPAQQMR